MAIPRNVARRAEKAREQARQMAGQQPTQQAPVAPVVTNVQEAPPVEGVTEEVQQVPVADAEVQPGMKVSMDDFETRYKNLRTSRNDRATKAEGRVEQLEQDLVEARRLGTVNQVNTSPFQLSDEERSEMSEDEVKVYERLGSKFEGTFAKQTEQTDAQREAIFFADIESVVPEWEEINASAGFIAWLQQPDGFSGRSRQGTLKVARSELDARTVSTLFGSYKNEVVATGGSDNGVVAPTAEVSIEPGRASSQANPMTGGDGAQAQIISAADVSAFYRKRNELIRRKRMTPELKEQFDAHDVEIRKAHAEGRVR